MEQGGAKVVQDAGHLLQAPPLDPPTEAAVTNQQEVTKGRIHNPEKYRTLCTGRPMGLPHPNLLVTVGDQAIVVTLTGMLTQTSIYPVVLGKVFPPHIETITSLLFHIDRVETLQTTPLLPPV